MRQLLMASLSALALIAPLSACAAESDDSEEKKPSVSDPQARAVYERLQELRPDWPIDRVEPSAIEELYRVELADGAQVFVTADLSHLITSRGFRNAGDLHAVRDGRFVNVTEADAAAQRARRLAQIDEEDMIVFSPQGETKGAVYVFTDVNCPYCQQLHQQMSAMNALGIEVRYLGYPRSGLTSGAYQQMVSAWCADDPREALTRLKNGEEISRATCDAPVAGQFELGQQLGVRGTPAIYDEQGTYLGGYKPPEALAEAIGLASVEAR